MHNHTLYHYWRSSCSWRVRWAMELKGLSYQSIPVNLLKGEHKNHDFLARNPSGQVPSFEINGKSFNESLAILEWIEENYPTPPLLPTDSMSKIKVRELSYMIAMGTQPLQNLKVQKYFSSDGAIRKSYANHWIQEGLEAFEKRVVETAGTYCFGSSVSFADLCLIPQCYNAERFGVNLEKFPVTHRIYNYCLATPACHASSPSQQPGAKA